jgi:methionyl-tRNA synthetase
MNEDIKERIREKIEDLTNLLLKNATDRILDILKNDTDVINSGFGEAVKKELTRRNQSMSKTLGKIKRGLDRTVNSSAIQSDILKDLTIINGFFNILKSQYDMTLELYEREFGEDWNKIWGVIQSTDEYINYMEPKDVRVAAEQISKSEETTKVAATIVTAGIQNNPELQPEDVSIQTESNNQTTETMTDNQTTETMTYNQTP